MEPPPTGQWQTDILGAPFLARTIALTADSEGENCATLVKHSPAKRRWWDFRKPATISPGTAGVTVLYLHGRNDYFFQTELAAKVSQMGAAFYALDLRKYGRSLRPWQTIGYTDDLGVYDEEITAAIRLIRMDHPDSKLVLMGHSTGGLIATLWANRNQGEVAGLILNSAWLELQSMTALRPFLNQALTGLAHYQPHATVMGASKLDTYYRSISQGWAGSQLPIPPGLPSQDPAVVGWRVFPEWKRPFSYPVPAAWLRAILVGHGQVADTVHLNFPVLAFSSTGSSDDGELTEDSFRTDIVLNSDLITQRAANLSNDVALVRLPGKHDLALSDPPVRDLFYRHIASWLRCSVQSA